MHWFSKLRPRALFAGLLAYWVILAALTLPPIVSAAWRATHASSTGHTGTFNAAITNWVLSLTVTLDGQVLWTGSRSILLLAFGIAGVPVLIWLLWLALREKEEQERV